MNPSSKPLLLIVGSAFFVVISFILLIWWGNRVPQGLREHNLLPQSDWPRIVDSRNIDGDVVVTNGVDGYRITVPMWWLMGEPVTRAGGLFFYFAPDRPEEIPLEYHEGGTFAVRLLAEKTAESPQEWLAKNREIYFPHYTLGEFQSGSISKYNYEALRLDGQTFEAIGSPPKKIPTDGLETIIVVKANGGIYTIECRIIGPGHDELHKQCVPRIDTFEAL